MPTDVSHNDVSTELSAQLQLLRAKYFDSLQQKEAELEDILATVSAYGLDAQTLKELYLIVHNLAGVAPTHGFHNVAKYASRIEKNISKAFHHSETEVPSMEILLKLEDLTREIRVTLEVGRLV